MTAQVSTAKRPGFLTYFLYRLGKLKFLTVILALLEFFTFPYYLIILDRFTLMALEPGPNDENMLETLRALTDGFNWYLFAAAIFGAMIVSFIIILSAFRYLHSKQYVNMDMTLPITHTQRFFGDMLASFTSVFVPHLLSVLAGTAIIAKINSYGAFDVLIEKSDTYSYYSYSLIHDLLVAEKIIPYVIIVFLMLYFMTLFIISTAGKRVTAIMMPIVMQIVIPAAILFTFAIIHSTTYGSETFSRFGDTGPIAVLSPVTFIFTYFGYKGIGDEPWILIVLAVYLAALCAGSYFIQKHRRAERTGDAFVLRYARHTYTVICILAATSYFWWEILCPRAAQESFFLMNRGYDTPVMFHVGVWLFVSLLIFVIAELVGGGKLKKLPFAAIRFVVTTAGCALLCCALTLTDGFGAAYYIPGKDSVSEITVHFSNGYDFITTSSLSYEDVTSLQKKIIAERPKPEKDLSGFYHISLSIYYNNDKGTFCSRGYGLTSEYEREVYDLIFKNGGLLNTDRYEEPQTSQTITGVDVKTGEQTKVTVYPVDTFISVRDSRDENDELKNYHVPAEKLIEALRADASETTFDKVYLSAYGSIKALTFMERYEGSSEVYAKGYAIYPFFERTWTLLEENGVDLSYTPEYREAFIVTFSNSQNSIENINSLRSAINRCESSQLRRLDVGSAEFDSALAITAAEKSYYTGSERYFLVIVADSNNGSGTEKIYLPIPEKYNDTAREIYENAAEDGDALDELLKDFSY